MKKKLALLLALVMVLALVFVGCDKDKDDDDKGSKTTTEAATTTVPLSTEELVVGEWSATVDFTDVLVASMLGSGMEDYFELKDFDLKVVYELKADKTYTIAMDEDTTEASAEKLADQMMDGMEAYMTDLLATSGVDMTFDEYLETQGMTADEYKESLKEEIMLSFEIVGEGTYTVDDDTIVLSEDGYDETTTFTYANGSLEFVSIESDEASAEEIEMMNDAFEGVTFKK